MRPPLAPGWWARRRAPPRPASRSSAVAGRNCPRSSTRATEGSGTFGRVHEGAEAAQPLRVGEGRRPLVLVGVDVLGHRGLELVGEAERVVHDDVAHVVEAALEVLDPARRALQAVGGADVVHHVAVDVADERLVVEVAREQLRVRRLEAAVAADVEVPALVGGDHAHVLAAGLGALAGASGDAELELVRRAEAAVAQLELHRHRDRVLHAVAAPGRADAALHVAQRLAVGLPGLEAGVDEHLPDLGELVEAGAEQVDALAARDLRVQAEVGRDLGDDRELLRRDLAGGDAGDHRVGAVLLHVRHRAVVRVLQAAAAAVEDVRAVLGREDGADRRACRRRSRGRCRAAR